MTMIAPIDATTRSTVDDVYNTEYITRNWRETARDPIIGAGLCKLVVLPLEEANSLLYEVPIVAEMTGVAAMSGTDAAPEDGLTTTVAQITCAEYGLRSFVKDNTRSRLMAVGAETQRQILRAHQDYYHRQILALFTSIAATSGTNATDFTLGVWDAHTQAHRAALITGGPLWAALNPDQNRDLRADLVSNAAALLGSAYGEQAAAALKDPVTGLMRSFDGYMIYETGDTPVGDTTGWTGALGVGGEDAGIELVMMQDLTAELQRDASRTGTWIVGTAIVGWGIVKQTQLRALVSRT